ncbi:MAG: substrate-binding domain-containing protein, partial [Kineosporiaceae bacterium]
MGRHTTGHGIGVGAVVVIMALAVVGAAAVTGALSTAGWLPWHVGGRDPSAAACSQAVREIRVLTASSFVPVLNRVSGDLAQDAQCLHLHVDQADGRTAPSQVAVDDADVWIPDDAAWAHLAPPGLLAPDQTHGAGSVLATSPFFMVTDEATARRLTEAGGSWLALARMVEKGDARLVVRDPAESGDGMVGAGSVAEAVWVQQGMDASALALEKIVKKVRTEQNGPALPTTTGDVGVVPEYAMIPVLAGSGPAPTLLAGRDHTAQLRYTWFPTAKAVNDPVRAAAVDQLRAALTGPGAAAALDAADLRSPTSPDPPSRGRQKVPALTAAPLPVLGGHHVNHVFASWYRDDRQMNVTMVVDVSWSMSTPAPG